MTSSFRLVLGSTCPAACKPLRQEATAALPPKVCCSAGLGEDTVGAAGLVSVRAGGVGLSGVDPVEPVVFGGVALGVEALGVDVVAGGGFDAVELELVVVRSGRAPARASQ
jgi:hypothetical protein